MSGPTHKLDDGVAVTAVTPLSRRSDGLALAGFVGRVMAPVGTAVGGLAVTQSAFPAIPSGRPTSGRGSVRNPPPPGGRTGGVGGEPLTSCTCLFLAKLPSLTALTAGTALPSLNWLTSCSRPYRPSATVDSPAATVGPELRAAVLDQGERELLERPFGAAFARPRTSRPYPLTSSTAARSARCGDGGAPRPHNGASKAQGLRRS